MIHDAYNLCMYCILFCFVFLNQQNPLAFPCLLCLFMCIKLFVQVCVCVCVQSFYSNVSLPLLLSSRRYRVVARSGAAFIPLGSGQKASQPVHHHPPQRYKPGNQSLCLLCSSCSQNQNHSYHH